MSRQNSNFLSLAIPINNEVTYVSRSPVGPPPGFPAENTESHHHVSASRRCSVCRQAGHNRRACPTLPSVSAPPSEGQQRMRLRRIIRAFLELSYPNSDWRRELQWIAVFGTYVCSLTLAQVEEGILNPIPIIRDVVRILYRISHPEYSPSAAPAIFLGKDHAKKISLVLDISCEETVEETECYICCEEKCSLKTSCGHEFCGTCVSNIIEAGKNTTSAPVCSFCRVPFTCLTTSESSVHTSINDFIKNL